MKMAGKDKVDKKRLSGFFHAENVFNEREIIKTD